MRISDWSSDVCSSDLILQHGTSDVHAESVTGGNLERRRANISHCPRPIVDANRSGNPALAHPWNRECTRVVGDCGDRTRPLACVSTGLQVSQPVWSDDNVAIEQYNVLGSCNPAAEIDRSRSEEHTYELQSLMRIPY